MADSVTADASGGAGASGGGCEADNAASVTPIAESARDQPHAAEKGGGAEGNDDDEGESGRTMKLSEQLDAAGFGDPQESYLEAAFGWLGGSLATQVSAAVALIAPAPAASSVPATASSTRRRLVAPAASSNMDGGGDGSTDGGQGLADIGAAAADGIGAEEAGDVTPTPWLQRIEVSSAKARKVRGGNYVQLATVTPEGLPRCRTVVFRGWLSRAGDDNVRAMKMITDGRSTKVAHVASSPAAELVWWFAKSSEQYRVAGQLQLVGGDELDAELNAARKQAWGNLSDKAREQFYWDSPNVPYSGAPSVPSGGRDNAGAMLPAPDTFLLMLLWPRSVKYLRLTDNFAQEDVLDANNQWSCARVNP